jgi:peptidyl-prolyl cis-trans isomerase D
VLEEGNNSDVIELTPEHYIVLRVKVHEPVTPKPLDEVKEQVLAAVRHERAMASAQQLAEQLRGDVERGGELLAVAEKGGYKGQKVQNVARGEGPNPEVTRAAFGIARPTADKAAIGVRSLANGDVAVIQLHAVIAGASDSLSPTQKSGLVSQLEQSSGTATFAATMESLRRAAKIERH